MTTSSSSLLFVSIFLLVSLQVSYGFPDFHLTSESSHCKTADCEMESFDALFSKQQEVVASNWAPGSKISTEGLRWSFVHMERIGLNVINVGNPDGPMVVLLHGFPESALLAWHAQLVYFAKQNKYFIVAPDMRGYNASEKPEGVEFYRLNELSQDIADLISHYGRQSAIVVGHDWGAAVAWWTAITHPTSVSKLVVLNTPHQVAMQEYLPKHLSQMRKSWYIMYFQLPWVAENFFRKDNYSWAVSTLASAAPETFAIDDVALYRRTWGQPRVVESMLSYYRGTLRYAFAEEGKLMQKIQKEKILVQPKTLILWGEKDDYLEAPLASLSLQFCRDGSLITLDASHWLQHELPEKIAKIFESFWDSPE